LRNLRLRSARSSLHWRSRRGYRREEDLELVGWRQLRLQHNPGVRPALWPQRLVFSRLQANGFSQLGSLGGAALRSSRRSGCAQKHRARAARPPGPSKPCLGRSAIGVRNAQPPREEELRPCAPSLEKRQVMLTRGPSCAEAEPECTSSCLCVMCFFRPLPNRFKIISRNQSLGFTGRQAWSSSPPCSCILRVP